MTVITATEASRGFRAMLDGVARGERYTITRDGMPIAEVNPPAPSHTVAALEQFLETWEPDPEWGDAVEEIHNQLNASGWRNPWDAE